jgi:hypothetical protein
MYEYRQGQIGCLYLMIKVCPDLCYSIHIIVIATSKVMYEYRQRTDSGTICNLRNVQISLGHA